jgi:PBP1b-binding outer membrane lipoprotein LpoB
MKRNIIILISLLVLAGCTITSSATSPKRAVEDMLGKYQSLDKEVTDQLDSVIAAENLTESQKKDYKDLMEKQYQNLSYEIKDETIDGDTAIVKVEIEVFDFAKANEDVEKYVTENPNQFLDANGTRSNTLYQDYKIGELKKVTDRIKYTLDLGLTKTNDNWKLDDLSDTERQKIHGLYIS